MNALIIFARYPKAGEVKTRLGKSLGMNKAADIYREFSRHAFAIGETLRRSGITVYLWYEPSASEEEMRNWVGHPFLYRPQEGNDLGARMMGSFEATFRDGATASVIIGTDVPELDATTVGAAFEALRSHETVIGPGHDGGYYLLGMTPPVKDLFSAIPWSTGVVLERTLGRIRELSLAHAELPVLHDVDTAEDYAEYRKRSGHHP